jgi:lipopolysaccharide/colanic/teichoic acid biosynthesis glycosyltransferase
LKLLLDEMYTAAVAEQLRERDHDVIAVAERADLRGTTPASSTGSSSSDRTCVSLMPGMTGPWQILGPARVPLREMGAIDYLYVANWSLWGDVKILLRTVPHVFGRRGL